MKKKNTPIEEVKAPQGKLMTRKQAIKKSGYMALSAATMMLLFNTSAQAVSPPTAPPAPTNTSDGKPDGIWND